jgi:O-glycosyl hydrolase
MKTAGLYYLATVLACSAVERATYDSAGGLTGLIDHGSELRLHGAVYAYFDGDVRYCVQPHDQRSPIARDGLKNHWTGTSTFPNSAQASITTTWDDSDRGLALATKVKSESMYLQVQSLDYVIDLPRELFVGGAVGEVTLGATKTKGRWILEKTTRELSIRNVDESWRLNIELDEPRAVSVSDIWDHSGRFFRIRIALRAGLLTPQDTVNFGLSIKAAARPQAMAALVRVDPSKRLYPFDGFGGNYCFATNTPAVEYTMEHLQSAWARLELKAQFWDAQRTAPGAQLVRDFELMQRVQQKGMPWVISVWRLPERFYTDANQKPFSTFARQIHPDRWPELLELLGSYFTYLKQHYGAEPDLFSFNEPDLGVNVGFSAESHRDMIKKIGRHFAQLGLKTKLLLGDTANPRDSHRYVLATAADPEALGYVGAVSFHSWGSGTPQQYRAWADVAEWLQLPLLVGEAGTDPGSYRNHMFDSYAYGLKEAQQYHELLRDARPRTLVFWEYTEDYGVVRVNPDKTVEPTGRFFLLKQFANLSPQKSHVVASESDQKDVLVSAFAAGERVAVHVLNLGAEREITIDGLTGEGWKSFTTTETQGYVETQIGAAPRSLKLPARSMTTIVRGM